MRIDVIVTERHRVSRFCDDFVILIQQVEGVCDQNPDKNLKLMR